MYTADLIQKVKAVPACDNNLEVQKSLFASWNGKNILFSTVHCLQLLGNVLQHNNLFFSFIYGILDFWIFNTIIHSKCKSTALLITWVSVCTVISTATHRTMNDIVLEPSIFSALKAKGDAWR